jgi:hypothetical protein
MEVKGRKIDRLTDKEKERQIERNREREKERKDLSVTEKKKARGRENEGKKVSIIVGIGAMDLRRVKKPVASTIKLFMSIIKTTLL